MVMQLNAYLSEKLIAVSVAQQRVGNECFETEMPLQAPSRWRSFHSWTAPLTVSCPQMLFRWLYSLRCELQSKHLDELFLDRQISGRGARRGGVLLMQMTWISSAGNWHRLHLEIASFQYPRETLPIEGEKDMLARHGCKEINVLGGGRKDNDTLLTMAK